MTKVMMRRKALNSFFPIPDTQDKILDDEKAFPHAGLYLARGLEEWNEDAGKKGVDFQNHIENTVKLCVPKIYESAYQRWEDISIGSGKTTAFWCGKVDGRLFVGLGGASILETAITMSHTYGVPMIPGAALKGLARAYAGTQNLALELKEGLFGKADADPKKSDTGYVLFYDAWWIPNNESKPLAAEIVTVHHQEYYAGKSDKATDFDSPIPNQQIAAQGSFLFVVECGNSEWAVYARDLLVIALQDWGVGGKTAAGYGHFREDERYTARLNAKQQEDELSNLPPEERILKEVEALDVTKIPKMLGRDKKKTLEKWGNEQAKYIECIRNIHGDKICVWKSSDNLNERKAFNVIFFDQN